MKQPIAAFPGWRSLLFIPVHIEKFVAKAHTRGADAYILDLEDSVPLKQKSEARQLVAEAAKRITDKGADVLVRINLEQSLALQDLEYAVDPCVKAIVVPKVESKEQVQHICNLIDEIESKKSIPLKQTQIIAMIESVEGLARVDEIASANSRISAITLGPEDFSASARMRPCRETLLYPNQQVALACRRAGITPLGFPGSIADYSDLDAFRETIKLAKDFGFAGAFCIHPKQVAVLNEELIPSEAEVDRARRLIQTYEQGIAEGKGAVEFEGKMVDMPVVISARELLATYERITARMSAAGH